jgi:uncharacterized protein
MKLTTTLYLMLLGLATSCSNLLYYPSRQLYRAPDEFATKPQDVFFSRPSGERLHGWYFASPNPKALIVFYHGNAENISSHSISVAWLAEKGFDLFAFDYGGYGRSEGSPSPQNTVIDGEAALRWAHKHRPHLPLVLYGQSLGGAVMLRNAIDLGKQLPVRLVVADSTFASYRSVARSALTQTWFTWPFQWIGWLALSDRYAPSGEIDTISPIPLVVIHGAKDRVVKPSLGKAIYEEAKEPKELWMIPSGEHIDLFMAQDISYRQRFVELLEKAVTGKKNP